MRIHWNDAFHRMGWRDIKDATSSPLHVVSLGFYIGKDDEFLYTTDGYFAGVSTDVAGFHGYPWGMITKIEVL